MADQPSPRCRFQFRLRTLMIGVTLLALVCAYVGGQAKIVKERKAVWYEIAVGQNGYRAGLVLLRTSDNEHAVSWLRQLSSEYRSHVRAVFPEASVLAIKEDLMPRTQTLVPWPDESRLATKP
jgi:hypothetical protein